MPTTSTARLVATIEEHIAKKEYQSVFMAGGCPFFALVLHEELGLLLYYSCPAEVDEVRHAFVMKGQRCLDFEGWKPIEKVAAAYALWPEVPPRPLSLDRLKEDIRKKNLGSDLESRLAHLAREGFSRNRSVYEEMA